MDVHFFMRMHVFHLSKSETYMHTYIHSYIHTYVTYIHTYINTYIHTYIQDDQDVSKASVKRITDLFIGAPTALVKSDSDSDSNSNIPHPICYISVSRPTNASVANTILTAMVHRYLDPAEYQPPQVCVRACVCVCVCF